MNNSQKDQARNPALLRSGLLVSSGTATSRVLGVVRDIATTSLLGAGPLHDAFVIALRIPNMFRRLLAEGAFSQALAPVLAQWDKQHGPHAAAQLTGQIFWVLALLLLLLIGIMEWGAEVVVQLVAPGFAPDSERYAATVSALQIMLPYLGCISLASVGLARLHQHNRFLIGAYAPISFNLCLITAAWWFADRNAVGSAPLIPLAWAVCIAGGIQLVLITAPAIFSGWIRLSAKPVLSEGVRKTARLMLPGLLIGGVIQANQLLNAIFASFLQTGSPTWLYLSDRLVQLPVGVFAISVAAILLPALSRHYANSDTDSFRHSMRWAMNWIVLISLPAACGLLVVGEPLIALLFEHGEFTREDTLSTSASLSVYALGLPGYMLVSILVPGYFSRQAPSIPMYIALGSVSTNALLAWVFAFYMQFGHVGLAGAATIAIWLQALVMMILLIRTGWCSLSGWPITLVRAIVASALMLLVLRLLPGLSISDSPLQLALGIAMYVGAGMITYTLAIVLLGQRLKQ